MQANSHQVDIGFSNNLINQLNRTQFIPLYFTQEQRNIYDDIQGNDEFVDILDILERGKYNSYVKDNLVYPTKKQTIFNIISTMIKVLLVEE